MREKSQSIVGELLVKLDGVGVTSAAGVRSLYRDLDLILVGSDSRGKLKRFPARMFLPPYGGEWVSERYSIASIYTSSLMLKTQRRITAR